MRPVSTRFLEVVRNSHKACFRATVVTGMPTGVSPVGIPIPILGGDIKLDANADIRGTLELTTEGAYWDVLDPYSAEIHVSRGIEFGGGEREWVSQGYYRIYNEDQEDAPKDGLIQVDGRDRMSGIVEARLEQPRQFVAGASVSAVFTALVLDVYPSAVIEYDFDAANTAFTGSHIAEEDRYQFLLDVVKALGKVMYWDHEGKLQVRDAPALTDPVADVTHGKNGVLVRMSRKRSREGVYNAVIVTGEAPGDAPAVRAVARDLAPTSPTYWGGPFGKVPKAYSSSFITTTQQAASAAAALLVRNLGLPYAVSFGMVPNPALEPLDVVTVSYRDRAQTELHVIDKLTVPLTASGVMDADTRRRASEGVDIEEVL